jgi:hypothetical protein
MATNQGQAGGLLDLLMGLEAHGAVLKRHGGFLGCLHPDRVPAALWRALDAHEGQLLRRVPDSPTPFQARQPRADR